MMGKRLTLNVLFCAAAFVGAAFGAHELYDPDLGWNLAGGLWILEQGRVPSADPFGATHHQWIDYCWLPQILFAGVYQAFGFHGLLFLQILLSSTAVVLGVELIAPKGEGRAEIVKAFAVALFIAPICHLRPQLISLILFELFLLWRQRNGTLFELFVVQLLWVNTHVYWCFVPALLLYDTIFERRFRLPLVMTALLGLASPYGIQNILVVLEYAFAHEHAIPLIREFQPLASTEGYLFPLALLSLVGAQFWQRRQERFVSFAAFLLALRQLKFTPIFGLLALRASSSGERGWRFILPASAVVALGGMLVVLEHPLRPQEQELLSLRGKLPARVANFFNEGGWLALAGFQTSIDGRTLVMGRNALTDYRHLMRGETPLCEYLAGKDAFVAHMNGKALKWFLESPCRTEFREVHRGIFSAWERTIP